MGCLDESTLLQVVAGGGGLDAARREAIDEHLVACGDCRRLLVEVARQSLAERSISNAPTLPDPGREMPLAERFAELGLPPGCTIGRYIVLGKLGAGGMGIVYAAYDPELDRKIALKLVRPEQSDAGGAQARILREARAIARLAHPNVVAVHDTGTHDDQVFLAMELVDGGNLAEWLARGKRTPVEMLAMFVQAGRGLAAAHAAGLVHRDFKPANVLVGKDGRARVTDFGLARDEGPRSGVSARLPSSPALSGRGALVGTPAYMAPEQLDPDGSESVDARTDQFGFAVALHEGLYGERPFAGETIFELAEATAAGRLVVPRKNPGLPPRVRRAIVRALAPRKQDRFPTMDALLAALAPPTSIGFFIGGGALVVASIAVAIALRPAAAATPCRGAERELAGVWDADRKAAVTKAFTASQQPFAGDALNGTVTALDRWTRGWVAARTDACEATRVRGDQSEALMDLRIACLDRRKKELATLVELFASADAALVQTAVNAAGSLGALDACADRAALAEVPPPPPAIAAQVRALDGEIADVVARLAAGRYDDARARALSIVERATPLGYRPLEADAVYTLGNIQEKQNDLPAAEPTLTRAALLAEAAGDDFILARALISLVDVVGYRGARHDEGRRLMERATAALERMGGDDALAGMLDYYRGALDIDTGRTADAAAAYERAIALFTKSLGPEHAFTIAAIDALGAAQLSLGQLDAALATEQRALELTERTVGPHHPDVAFALDKLGAALMALQRNDEARVAIERSIALREQTPGDPYYGASLINLADLERSLDHLPEALALHRRAVPVFEATLGPDHPYVGISMQAQSWLLAQLGRGAEALAAAERTVKIFEAHPELAQLPIALTRLGEAQLALGQPRRALPPLERAVALAAEMPDADVNVRAEPVFALARALRAARGDRARARELALAARASYLTAGPVGANDIAIIDAWLAEK